LNSISIDSFCQFRGYTFFAYVDVRWEKLNALLEAGTVETFLIDEQTYACNRSLYALDLSKTILLKKNFLARIS